MRFNGDFLEVTGVTNGKKFLVNKAAIIFVTPADSEEHSVIMTENGEHMYKILTRESYKEVSNVLLDWCELSIEPFFPRISAEPEPPKEEEV